MQVKPDFPKKQRFDKRLHAKSANVSIKMDSLKSSMRSSHHMDLMDLLSTSSCEIELAYTAGGFVWCDRPFYLVKWPQEGMADTHEYWSKHGAQLVYLPIFHGLNLIIFS